MRGGGVVFGPKPRRYATRLPKKVKHHARQRGHPGTFVIIVSWLCMIH
jgi:hypothetical protein